MIATQRKHKKDTLGYCLEVAIVGNHSKTGDMNLDEILENGKIVRSSSSCMVENQSYRLILQMIVQDSGGLGMGGVESTQVVAQAQMIELVVVYLRVRLRNDPVEVDTLAI